MNRLTNIASMLRQKGWDALLICCAEHIGGESMQYATGMHGLEGMVIVTAKGEEGDVGLRFDLGLHHGQRNGRRLQDVHRPRQGDRLQRV